MNQPPLVTRDDVPHLVAVGDRDDVHGRTDTRGGMAFMIDRYCKHLRFRHFATATLERRRRTLAQFAEFIDPVGLLEATRHDVEEFLGTKRAARTKHAYRSDLRSFYRWCVDRGHLTTSPAAQVESIRVPKSLPRPFPVSEAFGALHVGTRHTRRMVGLALLAGMRSAEIAGLMAEDVWLHASPPVVIVREGKGRKDRTVPLHPMLVDMLAGLPSSGPVFPGRGGRLCVSPRSVAASIRRHITAAGLVGTPHQFRHTFGTELARASGGDMVLTASLMGHESMNTTMNYVKLIGEQGASVVSVMFGEAA